MEKAKQTRVRCSDQKFLEAVYSSKTYAEIAEKTGQKIASTRTRYDRIKKSLVSRGVSLPRMQRSKPKKTINNIDAMIDIIRKLQE